MDWGFIFTCLSLPTSIYGIYELIKKLQLFIRKSNIKKILWKNLKEWVIVVPQYLNKYRRVEDAIASEKISTYCEQLGLNCSIQDDIRSIPTDRNLIIICGPKSNKVAEQLYNHFKIKFKSDSGDFYFWDELSQNIYMPQKNQSSSKNDYAVISRYFDSNTHRTCIFCAGLHGLGTLGAVTALINADFVNQIRKLDNFESIISVSALDRYFTAGTVEFIIPPRKL